MKITGKDGSQFEMLPEGFESWLPMRGLDHQLWLSAYFRAEAGGRYVKGRMSCLMGGEVRAMLKWFDSVAAGKIDMPFLSFTEPMLEFQLLPEESPTMLRVSVWLSTPYPVESNIPEKGMEVFFNLSEIDLAAAADELRKDLKEMPAQAAYSGCLPAIAVALLTLFDSRSRGE